MGFLFVLMLILIIYCWCKDRQGSSATESKTNQGSRSTQPMDRCTPPQRKPTSGASVVLKYETNIKTDTPKYANTEYATAVFLSLHKMGAHRQDACAHIGYLRYKLGIDNAVNKHQELLNHGYFQEANQTEILKKLKVAELKKILEDNGKPTTGKKDELINRIVQSVPADSLNLEKMYCISSQGLEFIEQHQDLIELFRNPYDVTYEEYKHEKDSHPSYMKYRDLIWAVFQTRELSFAPLDNFKRRYNAWYRAQFLKDEKKFRSALADFLRVAYYDINDPKFYIKRSANAAKPETVLEESLVEEIVSLEEYYSMEVVQKALRGVDFVEKHISTQNFCNFIEKLFSTRNADFSAYIK